MDRRDTIYEIQAITRAASILGLIPAQYAGTQFTTPVTASGLPKPTVLRVIRNLRVIYLDKLNGTQAIGIMKSAVGKSAPAYCTGLGEELLGVRDDDPAGRLASAGELVTMTPNTRWDLDDLRVELKRIRKRGYALDLEDHKPGVRRVAATINGTDDKMVAALSIAGPAQRLSKSRLNGELAEARMRAADEISRRLGAPTRKRAAG